MIKIYIYKNLKKIILSLAIIIFLFISYKISEDQNERAGECFCTENSSYEASVRDSYFFEVMGQVNEPGVYEYDKKIIVIEAIDLAGGFAEQADLAFIHKYLSLASEVKPSQKIYIPALEESYTLNNYTSDSDINSGLIKINLNTADRKTLMTISGVGEVTADKLINLRPIKSLDDLKELIGVPQKTIANIIEKAQL